ncbi:MAG: hypothetical protein PHH49_03275 [Candidatus Omnitrophica bacterium]|nr:hypothetical protein [Candidatus Omnitrophota bacterium]MDD5487969.1 hypothetical protein [Candidatus Omnitrophota bacterium]
MFIKKKNVFVAIFSSGIIALVFISTLAGYLLYGQWRKDSLASKYRFSIYSLTADIFRNEVVISNIRVKLEGDHADVPILEWAVKNNSGKTIVSILLEVGFVKDDGTVVYKAWLKPLDEAGAVLHDKLYDDLGAGKGIAPGETLSFRQPLRNCPEGMIERIASRDSFARNEFAENIELKYTLKGLKLI